MQTRWSIRQRSSASRWPYQAWRRPQALRTGIPLRGPSKTCSVLQHREFPHHHLLPAVAYRPHWRHNDHRVCPTRAARDGPSAQWSVDTPSRERIPASAAPTTKGKIRQCRIDGRRTNSPGRSNPPKRAARMESSKVNANVIVPIVSKKQNAPDSSVSSEENRRLAVAEKRKKAIMSTDTVHGLVPRGSTKMLDHAFYWPKHSTAKNMPGDQGEQVDDDVGGKTVRQETTTCKRRATNLIMNYGIMSKGMSTLNQEGYSDFGQEMHPTPTSTTTARQGGGRVRTSTMISPKCT